MEINIYNKFHNNLPASFQDVLLWNKLLNAVVNSKAFFLDIHLLQEPPEKRQLLLLVVLLHNVREAEQWEPLPAAPHRWAVDLRALCQRRQEGTIITEGGPHDEVGRYTGVRPDAALCFLQELIKMLENKTSVVVEGDFIAAMENICIVQKKIMKISEYDTYSIQMSRWSTIS